jgi:hypothetical protein
MPTVHFNAPEVIVVLFKAVSRSTATLPLPSGVQGTIAVTLERGPSGASAPTSAPLMAVVVA